MRNSRIILSKNIKLDKNYTNVLNYPEEQMVQLCLNNKVYESNSYSFLRSTQTIQVKVPYGTVLKCNYMAFQNPDYSNKWFFAWIDDVIYKSNENTEIVYTIDSWSTWFSYWTRKECYVMREHVWDDTIGKNTIEENINIGRVEQISETEVLTLSKKFWVCIMSDWLPYGEKGQFSDGIVIYNGTFISTPIFAFEYDPDDIDTILEQVKNFIKTTNEDAHISSIKDIFMVPYELINPEDVDSTHHFVTALTTKPKELGINILKKYSWSDYTPKNNKLYCYPYNYLYVTNNSGNSNTFRYEDFEQLQCQFLISMCLCVGVSGKLTPLGYKGMDENDDESLPLAKYPVCSWSSDAYTNWITQNSVNMQQQMFNGMFGSILGGASAGANIVSSGIQNQQAMASAKNVSDVKMSTGIEPISLGLNLIGNTVNSVLSIMGQFHQASLLPNITGGQNVGDVNFSMGLNTFTFRSMRCKLEYLKQIDDFFSRFRLCDKQSKKS